MKSPNLKASRLKNQNLVLRYKNNAFLSWLQGSFFVIYFFIDDKGLIKAANSSLLEEEIEPLQAY